MRRPRPSAMNLTPLVPAARLGYGFGFDVPSPALRHSTGERGAVYEKTHVFQLRG